MKIIFRPFKPCNEDAEGILELDQLTFGDCKYSIEEIIKISQMDGNQIFIAEVENSIIGFLSLLSVSTLHYHGMWVDLIAVHPDYQNRGIGKKLLERAIEYGKAKNIEMLSGLIAKNNAASQRAFQNSQFHIMEKEFVLAVYAFNEQS